MVLTFRVGIGKSRRGGIFFCFIFCPAVEFGTRMTELTLTAATYDAVGLQVQGAGTTDVTLLAAKCK